MSPGSLKERTGASATGGKRVLVLEDNEHLRGLIEVFLKDKGLEVVSHGDGARGLAWLEKHRADLVLTDVNMPRLDGLKFLNRARKRWPGLKVLLMTTKSAITMDQLLEAIRGQANGFLEKPFSLVALDRAVKEALESADASPQPSKALTARYELLAEIARGAMGTVYKARQIDLGRIVAVKLQPRPAGDHTPPPEGPSTSQRIRAEAAILARLRHPNIAVVYDFGHDGPNDFFAMEYVQGATLGQYLDRRRRTVEEIVEVVLPIVDALAHAHDLGVQHHDVKPNNIMISWEGRPVLVDFGVATDARSPAERKEYLFGTLFYLAPEYLAGEPFTEFCDMYSFGVMLYEALSRPGAHPYVGDLSTVNDLNELLHAFRSLPYRPLPERQGLTPALADCVRSLVAVDPGDRPGSMHEVHLALRHALR